RHVMEPLGTTSRTSVKEKTMTPAFGLEKAAHDDRSERGVALVLAILALLLLTFLGLTLTATTSTEVQIANNFRWSQQALYNAEAGMEAARRLITTATPAVILPGFRPSSWDPQTGGPAE